MNRRKSRLRRRAAPIYDRDYVSAKRQERGYSVNPWTTHSRFIVSQALIRNEAYAGALRDWLGEFQGGSLFILDEAHNAAPASGTKYAIDSKLTRAVRDLTPRFEHKLFLSATPHNGHSNSFSALLEMLDPQKFCRGVPVHRASRDAVMIRRLKHDLREIGEEFPERKVVSIDIEGLHEDAPELVLSHLLQRYRRAREARLEDATKSQRASALLVVISLQKRLLSSIEAFARTLDVHRRTMKRQVENAGAPPAAPEVRPETLSLLVSPLGSDDERAELPEEEVATEDDAQMEAATAASAGPADEMGPELGLLDEMAGIANHARYEPDSRVRHLVAWVKAHLCPDLGAPDARWNDRRVLIFTEYTDTKRYLVQQLQAAIAGSDRDSERIMTFHGGIGEERREAIKGRLQRRSGPSSVAYPGGDRCRSRGHQPSEPLRRSTSPAGGCLRPSWIPRDEPTDVRQAPFEAPGVPRPVDLRLRPLTRTAGRPSWSSSPTIVRPQPPRRTPWPVSQ